jgi:hypothetical protein
MIRTAVIDNGLSYVRSCYRSSEAIDFAFVPAQMAHASSLHAHDWVMVPNGCDHVALWRARGAVAAVLARGGAVVCGEGWFTDWVPGLQTGRKIAVFGDSAAVWPGVRWESRPVDNAWWRKDPSRPHITGVQQIRHLDNYNDALTHWLCQQRPSGPFTVERRWYAVRNFRPAVPVAAEAAPSL